MKKEIALFALALTCALGSAANAAPKASYNKGDNNLYGAAKAVGTFCAKQAKGTVMDRDNSFSPTGAEAKNIRVPHNKGKSI